MPQDKNSQIVGALYSTAFGDAWGNPTEFASFHQNLAEAPEYPEHAEITDDTQMSLYAINVILNNQKLVAEYDITTDENRRKEIRDELRLKFAQEFTIWLHDPDNNRAPGNTCLGSLQAFQSYRNPKDGFEGTNYQSKGCGANMRAMWLGLLPYTEQTITDLAVIQSQTTHGHPLALSAAAVTALAVNGIFTGKVTPSKEGTLFHWVNKKVHELKNYSAWDENYTQGLEDLEPVIFNGLIAYNTFKTTDYYTDVNSFFGEGWVAEEALVNAIAVTDLYSDNLVEGLRRLVWTQGDSDSIAAIGGAMLGTHLGPVSITAEWTEHLEPRYKKEIADTTARLVKLNGN